VTVTDLLVRQGIPSSRQEAAVADELIKIPDKANGESTAERPLVDLLAGKVVTPADKPQITDKPEARRNYGAMASSLILVFFIVAAAILSVSFFAATQFQGKLSEYQISGVPLTVWRLESILKKHQAIQTDIDGRRAGLRVTESALNERSFFLTQKQAEVDKSQELFRQRAVETITLAIQLDPSLADRLSVDRPVESLALIRSHSPVASNGDIQTRLSGLEKISGPTAERMLEAVQVNAEVRGLDARIAKEQQALEVTTGALATALGLATTTPDAAAARERIENLLSELSSIGASSNWYDQLVYSFARIPRELIVLALVLSMGMLGSALYMATRFEEDYQRLTWQGQVLRPCAGAVTALVLYIVVKAGLLVVADATQLGGSAPVNPFFISFLGIVAGLMSERVIQAVRGVGENFLQKGGEDARDQVRWASADLTPILTASKHTTDKLTPYLTPLTPGEVNDIIVGKKGAKAYEQQIIAAFVQRQPREIFTDIRAPIYQG
jgi:hypothetical protein